MERTALVSMDPLNPHLSENQRRAFENEGWHVVVENFADRALYLVGAFLPDVVVITDHLQPMDGFALCTFIKAGKETGRIPVVVVSSAPELFHTRAIQAHADRLLHQEMVGRHVVQKVEALLASAA